jgi:hypothetical protein
VADAGTVVINLDANSVKLQREMDKADRATRRATERMRRQTVAEFKKMGKQAALFSAAVAGAMAVAVRSSVQFADSIGKTADKVGVGTDALQELRFAASQAGVAQSALDMGLQRFSRRVGEAVQGQGELVKTLEQYNIQLRNADGSTRAVEDILRDYADAVANAGSKQEQLRLAFKGFDSEGAALVNLLRGGADAINAYAQQARELGIVLEERLIRGAEETANKMDILNKALKVQVSAVVLENADAINTLVQSLIGLIPPLVNGTARLLEFFGILKQLPASVYEENIAILGQQLRQADADIEAANGRNKRAAQLRKQRLVRELREQEDLLKASRERTAQFYDQMKLPQIEVPDAPSITPPPPVAPVGTVGTDGEPTAAAAAALERYKNLQLEVQRALEDSRTPAEQFVDQMVRLAQLERAGLTTEAADRLRQEAAERFAASADAAEETVSKMTVFADQAARNMQDAFADFLFDPFEDGLKGMLKSFIDTLRRMAAEAAAAAIFNALPGGGVAGFIGGLFGGKRADGGPVTGGTPYLVGERGPELFVPGSSGSIVPNHAMGGDVVFNIDARGADAQLTRALPAILEGFGQRIKGDIAENMSRGRGLR